VERGEGGRADSSTNRVNSKQKLMCLCDVQQEESATFQRTLSVTIQDYVNVSYNPSAPRKLERSTSSHNVLTGAISSSHTRDTASERTLQKMSRSAVNSTRSLDSPAGSPSRGPIGSGINSPRNGTASSPSTSRAVSLQGSIAFEDRTIKQSNIDNSYADSVRTVVLHKETG